MKKQSRGRPPLQPGKPLMVAYTIRLTGEMAEEIERQAEDQARSGVDKAQVIRNLIAKGLGWD